MGLIAALAVLFHTAALPRTTEVVAQDPDPLIIRDPEVRDAIRDSKKPWKIRDVATGIDFVLVPQGASYVGANDDDTIASPDEKPRFHVTASKAFYVAETEVTFAQWRKTAGNREHGIEPMGGFVIDGDHQPVVMVSWNTVNLWCIARGWRLPDEREWEYAARGRINAIRPTTWGWGNIPGDGEGHGNVPDLTARKVETGWDVFPFEDGFTVSSPAKSFKPNAFGLYDMIGNVNEWCANEYDPKIYTTWSKLRGLRAEPKPTVIAPTADPKAATDEMMPLVKYTVRGGAWYPPLTACRHSYRWGFVSMTELATLGFRPVRDS